MAESTKSVADVKESISQSFKGVNETISNTAKDFSLLTKELIQKESLVVQHFKDHAAKDVKQVQHNYMEKEERVYNFFNPEKNPGKKNNPIGQSQEVAKEYERILQENISKLREIAQEDFKTSNANNKKLIAETKNKLHDFISKAFTDHQSKEDFTKTAGAIFASVNEKIREDLHSKSASVVRTRSTLSPDYGNVFVHSINRPQEEIEAEQALKQLFEEQLMEFNGQIKKDFQDINTRISKVVQETQVKVTDTLQSAKETAVVKATEAAAGSTSMPNLPPASALEDNMKKLFVQASKDFENVSVIMKSDVEKNKQQINENATYYAEKFLGRHFMGTDEDED